MGQPIQPTIKKISDIKHKLLQPALTSHFICSIEFPNSEGFRKVLADNGFALGNIRENLSISCCEASLPGSSLATHELNNDFTGITQKHAYRRLFDDKAEFAFYVDQDYNQIRIFEAWMRYISGEQIAFGEANNVSYRINYPKNYKSPAIYITKFERNIGTKETSQKTFSYAFINAFPISMNSIQVSYDTSSLLKSTVSFTYDRYIANNVAGQSEDYITGSSGININPYNQFTSQQFLAGANLNIAPNQNNLSANFNPGTASNITTSTGDVLPPPVNVA